MSRLPCGVESRILRCNRTIAKAIQPKPRNWIRNARAGVRKASRKGFSVREIPERRELETATEGSQEIASAPGREIHDQTAK